MIELIAGEGVHAKLDVAVDTYYTAVYLTKLAKETQIEMSYITALGTDQFSQRILGEMNRHGIRTNHIEIRDGQMPGLYAISIDEQGERSFSYWRAQSAARGLFKAPCKIMPQTLLEFDLVYISGISMAILPPDTRETLFEGLTEFRQAGGKLVFDSNYRPLLWQDVKTTPALLLAAATVNIPAIALSVGSMLNGWHRGERTGSGTVIWKAHEQLAPGEINNEEFMELAASSAPSTGYCNTMGTATTMNSLAEALGMQLPGSAAIPAPYHERG